MNKIALLLVDKDVAIMPVFNLQDIGDYRVCCLRFNEIFTSFLESTVMFRTKIIQEKLIKRLFICFSD